MRKLKLQPKRRQLAATITIALITGFISIVVLAMSFMNQAVQSSVNETYAGAAVIVDPNPQTDGYAGNATASNTPLPVDATFLEQAEFLENLPEVDSVYPVPQFEAGVILDENIEVQPQSNIFSLGRFATYTMDRPAAEVKLEYGSLPTELNQVLIDHVLAEQKNLNIGDKLHFYSLNTGETVDLEISGIRQAPLWQLFSPTSHELKVNAETIQKLLGDGSLEITDLSGEVIAISTTSQSKIGVSPAAGITVDQLKQALSDAGYVNMEDGSEVKQQKLDEIGLALLGVAVLLSGFIAVALMTSVLVVSNSFAVTVAQRRRSFALARALGATNQQTISRVIYDSLLVGVVGSILGIVGAYALFWLGLLLARNLFSPAVPVTPELNVLAILLPFIAGTLLALAASVIPALSVMRLKPLEALRPAEVTQGARAGMIRVIISLLLLAFGTAILGMALLMALNSKQPSEIAVLLCVLGGGSFVFGLVAFMPLLVKPFAKAFGAISSALGSVSARFAALNANRHPKRTATTASAVMIGAALMAMMTTGASTAERTLLHDLNSRTPIDVVVNMLEAPDELAGKFSAIQGVAQVENVPVAQVPVVNGEVLTVSAPSATQLNQMSRLEGLANQVEPNTLVMNKFQAEHWNLNAGQLITVKSTQGNDVELTVKTLENLDLALVDEATYAILTDGTSAGSVEAVLDSNGLPSQTLPLDGIWVKLAEPNDASRNNRSPDAILNEIQQNLQQSPEIEVEDFKSDGATRETYTNIINTLLVSTFVLLAVAVLVALVGVANTLSLSVVERQGENALLRALGTSKSQIQAMLAWEGILIALLGTLVGAATGIAFGLLGVKVLVGESAVFIPSIPWLQILAVAAAASLAALLASLIPGRIAANTQPAQALAQRDE